MKPNKKLGQNFLTSQNALELIAQKLEIKDSETIIEIGAGHGELTEKLEKNNKNTQLILIEKDKYLIPLLKNKFPRASIYEGDALKLLPDIVKELSLAKAGHKYKIAGNIPYYITGHLLRTIEELDPRPETTILTIQKEVAERIIAKPPKINLLAASIQVWADPELLLIISKENFYPKPKVDSATILLKTKSREITREERENYFPLIKTLFQKPRKTLINNLKGTAYERLITALPKFKIGEKTRPQELSITTLVKLAELTEKES